MTRVTIGSLDTNFHSHKFTVRSISSNRIVSKALNMIKTNTMALPDDKPIISIKVSPSRCSNSQGRCRCEDDRSYIVPKMLGDKKVTRKEDLETIGNGTKLLNT